MRRAILIFAVLCGLAGSGTPLPAPAADAPLTKYQREQLRRFKDSAPADHYFGRLKMSFLGVNNTLRFEALRAGDHTIDPSIVNKVNYADDSLQAWAAEYPRDPQLAHSYFLAVLVYQKIWTKPAQERAWAYMQLILAKYPETYFAKRVRNDIAAGFTERYYADPLPCPTPLPSATPPPSPIPSPAPSPTASPRTTLCGLRLRRNGPTTDRRPCRRSSPRRPGRGLMDSSRQSRRRFRTRPSRTPTTWRHSGSAFRYRSERGLAQRWHG